MDVVVLILFGLLTSLAIFGFLKGKNQLATWSILGLGILLISYMSADPYLHQWDEKYHALVAKNLMNHPLKPTLYEVPVLDYPVNEWTQNHVWLHKQPLPLWSMALSMKVFGVNTWGVRIPSILLFVVGIFISMEIGKRLFNQKAGFITGYLFAINGLMLDVGSGRWATDHFDLQFMVYILAAIFFAVLAKDTNKSKWNYLVGVCLGLALLTKWLPALIVMPVWGILHLKTYHWKKLLVEGVKILGVALLLFLPWQIYTFWAFPEEAWIEFSYNLHHAGNAVESREGGFFYHFNYMRIHYGGLIYLVFAYAIYQWYKDRNENRLALLIWILIPYLFFSFVQTKMPAYTLIAGPALLLLTGAFCVRLQENRLGLIKKEWLRYIVVVLCIGLPVVYSLERVKLFSNNHDIPEYVVELNQLETEYSDTTIFFNVNQNIEGMFYTKHIFYQRKPTLEEIHTLEQKGYQVIVNDSVLGEFPEHTLDLVSPPK